MAGLTQNRRSHHVQIATRKHLTWPDYTRKRRWGSPRLEEKEESHEHPNREKNGTANESYTPQARPATKDAQYQREQHEGGADAEREHHVIRAERKHTKKRSDDTECKTDERQATKAVFLPRKMRMPFGSNAKHPFGEPCATQCQPARSTT
jgi:hypothetical protein